MVYVIVLFCVALWLNGRRVRGTWSNKPTIHPFPYQGDDKATIGMFFLTGAFNGMPHTERQAHEMRSEADVFVVEYPTRLFSAVRVVKAVAAAIKSAKQYDRIILVGYSLGGLLVLRILEFIFAGNPAMACRIELIVGDSPLGPQHLLIPGGKPIPKSLRSSWLRVAPLLRFIHPGPILNLLSSFVAKVFFVEMEEAKREPGTDPDQFKRHMAFLRANLVSLIVGQIAAIASQKPFKNRPRSNRVTYLQCDHDVVVAGDEAREGWKRLFPNMTVVKLGLGTQHVAIVEAHEAWMAGLRQGVLSRAA